ncbi:MAG: hypothetical protein LUG16_03790 [Candidatus Gastranaerophilales bacterium]|nr:hypothetical protein [Candidatus Gastranaerophilales bacterium]
MRLKIEYETREGESDFLYIRILHRGKLLDEAKIKTGGRNKDEITNAKIRFISDFCAENSEIKSQDVLKSFALKDDVLMQLYKTQYPRGGYRGGGRPKGTARTETLNQRLTPEEKKYLTDQLDRYRKRHVLIDKLNNDSKKPDIQS